VDRNCESGTIKKLQRVAIGFREFLRMADFAAFSRPVS
jgi:hypothetical protein